MFLITLSNVYSLVHYYQTGSILSKINHCFSCDVSDVKCSDHNHLVDIDIIL